MITLQTPKSTFQRSDRGSTSAGAPKSIQPASYVVTSAEVAECSCPDPCERDHDRD